MKIGPDDREVLTAEATALASALPPGDERDSYLQLAGVAERGEVPEDWDARVGEVAALALDTGRVRSVHGPAGVHTMLALWKASPQGRMASGPLEDLNFALEAFRDLPVRSLRVSATGPGSYSMSIAAGDVEMRLAIDRSGVVLRTVGVGATGGGE